MPANMASTVSSQPTTTSTSHPATPSTSASNGTAAAGSSSGTTAPPVPHIRIVPHLDAPRSLHFDVVDKDVPEGFVLKIGRFTDKQNLPNRITFRSKVVSRGHAEIFTEMGKFYIRDTKSSSGTFLNHARLSPPGCESKPTLLKDGDVVQLGVDYQGGTQEIYRCVKMRLEINRGWQQQANPFRANTLKAIKSLTTQNASTATDCCICLFRIASFQSLFVAPCSHIFHYKCIRPLLVSNHPGFLCPLCRTFANLEDSVEIDDPTEEEKAVENAIEASLSDPTTTEAATSTTHRSGQGNGATATSAQAEEQTPEEQQQRQQDTSFSSAEHQGSSSATSAPVPVNGRSGNIPASSLAAGGGDGALAPPMSPGLGDICAPTPPSDLAHTFQPLQRPVSAINSQNGSSTNHEGSLERLVEDDGHQQPSRQASLPSTSAQNGQINTNPGVVSSPSIPSPMRPRSSSSSVSMGSGRQATQQQQRTRSPSTSSPSANHHQSSSSLSSSASSPSSNFLANFMRSMTMPRSRSRTNSANHTHAHAQPHPQPPSSPSGGGSVAVSSADNSNATGNASTSDGQGTTSNATSTTTGRSHQATRDLHHDVYGKTLVVTPPPMLTGPMRHGASSNGLGPVREMDAEALHGEGRVALAAMQEEEEGQATEDDDGAVSGSVDDGTNSSSDGDVLMFGVEAGGTTQQQQQQQGTSTGGGCEVVVNSTGPRGTDELQHAQETMTA
ncbi:hypothetical protein BGW42_003079 [Actinomortierella wolfii]|nr:hypothetical protein BGW42_003079 [Actinomortierella wolfii]